MRWDMAQTVEFMACKAVEIPIQKQNFKPKQFEIIDEDKRLISGWATVEIVDKQGEIVPVSEMKKAMYAFMDRGGHVIFKHSNKPVGKVLKWDIEKHPEAGVYGIKIVAKIFDEYPIDNLVWDMIKQGKLKGFSIGATAKAKRMVLKEPKKGLPREVGVLHDLSLMEISLVEEPANPLALIEEVNYVAKGDDVSEQIDIKPSSTPAITREAQKKDDEKLIRKRIELLESMTKVKELAKEVREKASDVLFEILKMKREEIAKALDEELVEVMKPFGKWKNFDDCVRDMKSRGYSEESAKRICGKLQAELEHKKQQTALGGEMVPRQYRRYIKREDIGKLPPGTRIYQGERGGLFVDIRQVPIGRLLRTGVEPVEASTPEKEQAWLMKMFSWYPTDREMLREEILRRAKDYAEAGDIESGAFLLHALVNENLHSIAREVEDILGIKESDAYRIVNEYYIRREYGDEAEKQERRAGRPKTDEERAMEHFGISPEEWEQLSEDEKRRYIERLPPRGEGLKGDDVEEEIGEWEPPKKPKNWTAFKMKYHVIKALERLGLVEKRRKTKPPKKWWDYCVEVVSEGNPDYTDEQVRAVCGSMWYHEWGLGSPKGVREHA